MKSGFLLKFLLFFLVLTAFLALTCYALGDFKPPYNKSPVYLSVHADEAPYKTVIIDAGHGGEDGGASSAAGLLEKEVNLDIANILCDMLRASGIDTVMTRVDDRLLYDRNVDFKGRKKKLDLAARLNVAQSTPDAIFVSIHMNSYPNPKYSGLQVWYSQNDPDSEVLAELIRNTNTKMLQPNNKRAITAAGSSIFILNNAPCPAVLVECGFLSNAEEAARFESDEYKQKVAFVIFCSISEFLNGQ